MLIIFSVGSEVAFHQSWNICAGQVATSVNIHNIGVGINCKLNTLIIYMSMYLCMKHIHEISTLHSFMLCTERTLIRETLPVVRPSLV
jgi:hypothetical protein